MKLIQILLSQPQSELVSRVKALGLSCNANSRQELTEMLTKTLLNKESTVKQWEVLEEKERQLLLQMSFSSNISFPVGELSTCLKRSDKSDLYGILDTLKGKGWIFQDTWKQCVIPVELREWIVTKYSNHLKENSIFIPSSESNNLHVIDDLFQFMDYVEEKKVKLTKQGAIYQNQLLDILNCLSKKETPPKEQWRFGYGRHFYTYPDCFSFLYDFCYQQMWIQEGEELTTTLNWEKGQMLSLREMNNRLLRSYIQLYKRAIPQISFLVEMLLNVLSDRSAIEKEELVNSLQTFVDPYYYDEPKDIIKKRLLNMLTYIQVLSCEEIDQCEFIFLHPRLILEKKKN